MLGPSGTCGQSLSSRLVPKLRTRYEVPSDLSLEAAHEVEQSLCGVQIDPAGMRKLRNNYE